MKSFIIWSGGKTRSLKKIHQNLPKEINNYFEPFVGGGSVFMSLKDKIKGKIYISDINNILINSYKIIRDYPKKFYKKLNNLIKEYNNSYDKKQFYLDKRNIFNNRINKLDFYNAVLFYFLIRAGFNGQWRLNSSGLLNMGWGRHPKLIEYKPENVLELSKFLKKVNIKSSHYKNILKKIKKHDFVYLDPPYLPIKTQKTNFNAYTASKWGPKEHGEFFDFVHKLNNKGAYILMSNNNLSIIKKIFPTFKFKSLKILRSVGSKSSSKKIIKELLIKNY